MKTLTFSIRTAKEIVRDPLNIAFGLGFPVVLLLMLSAIQANIPVSLFEIEHLAPGVAVFGLSFLTLFTATLVSRDRESALAKRLYTTPLTALDFILGYTLPIIPIALAEAAVCFLLAMILGLAPSLHILLSLLAIIPTALLYIGLGLLFGSILGVKQVGGICGALLTNLSAWLSGIWFDIELVGGVFKSIANLLPFIHAVELERAVLVGGDGILGHLLWVLGYAIVIIALAVFLFYRQMKKQ